MIYLLIFLLASIGIWGAYNMRHVQDDVKPMGGIFVGSFLGLSIWMLLIAIFWPHG